MKCPECGSTNVHRDAAVDSQFGPYGCDECGWSEIFPYFDEEYGDPDEEEEEQ